MFQLLSAPLFGPKHLIGLLYVIILIVIGLKLLGENYSKKKILTIIIVFFTLEVLKLGYMIIRDGSFPLNHLPLHLCSIPLYAYPALYFAKEGSYFERVAKTTSFIIVIAAGVTALLQPQNIIGSNEAWFPLDGNYLPFISFTFHGFMICAPLYLIRSKYYQPKWNDFLYAVQLTLGLMVLALIANAEMNEDFMLLNEGKGSPFEFLLENGQLIYTGTMILLGVVMITIVSLITTTLYKVMNK